MENDKKQLYHLWCEPLENFLKRIDECGGWPYNAKSVVMKHCCERERPCYFSLAENVRDEWNTSICSADDYYIWKLSDSAKQKIRDEERKRIIRQLGGFGG
jgi:hypothetical protein